MKNRAGTEVVNRVCTPVNAALGLYKHLWQTGDTATPGDFIAYCRATLSSGDILTFPNHDDIQVKIRKA